MSVFNDIDWANKGNDEICISNFFFKKKKAREKIVAKDTGRSSVLETKWNARPHTWKKQDAERFKDTSHQDFKRISAFESWNSELEQKKPCTLMRMLLA